jgi:RNA polymerase primary sigma factor
MLRFIYSKASAWAGSNTPLLNDLVQEGALGLLQAIPRYKFNKGASFLTYATYWMFSRMIAFIYSNGQIRIPLWAAAILSKYREELQKHPTHRNLPPMSKETQKALLCQVPAIELSCEKDLTQVPNTMAQKDPVHITETRALEQTIRSCLRQLTPKEEEVLTLRFGLYGGNPKTLEQIGNEWSYKRVTREFIRSIEARALRRLRLPSRLHVLRNFYFDVTE